MTPADKTQTTAPFIAYRIHDIARGSFPEVKPAPPDRWWMDVTMEGWPNRCLPLRVANQLGWWILNDQEFTAEWNGKKDLTGVTFSPEGQKPFYVHSMFGGGILTWVIPYLFRTPPGWQLLVRGPVNYLKDGIGPLEGLAETDWSTSTFTMNWRFTREGKRVKFEKGEPIAMVLPVRLGELESLQPEIRNIESTPSLHEEFRTWYRSRLQKVAEKKQDNGSARDIEGHYVRGETVSGQKAPEHRPQLKLNAFTEVEAGHPAPLPQQKQESRSWVDRLIKR
jgi:hypothetical protein